MPTLSSRAYSHLQKQCDAKDRAQNHVCASEPHIVFLRRTLRLIRCVDLFCVGEVFRRVFCKVRFQERFGLWKRHVKVV
jgi:hypothetical protein